MTDEVPVWTLVAVAIPGLIALAAQLVGAFSASRRDVGARTRIKFADALAAVVAYEEFPYVIRRRRASDPEGERIRISTEVQNIQEQLGHHTAWLTTESAEVAETYRELVGALRRVAGSEMHRAWTDPAITTDEQMNIPPELVDLRDLAGYKAAYLKVVRIHFSWWRRLLPHDRPQAGSVDGSPSSDRTAR